MKCSLRELILTRGIMCIASVLIAYTVEGSPMFNSVESGIATVAQNANSTTINQTTDSVVLNWHTFNIAEGEMVRFNQPSSSAVAVNSIIDTNPSRIFGSLSANGRVVLLNPNGFYFGATSSVSANTFIVAATTLANSHYNVQSNTLTNSNPSLIVSNIESYGTIQVTDRVQLIAKSIHQSGTISASHFGEISIRAASSITISGAVTAPQGTIDIFALQGVATAEASAVISTQSEEYQYNQAPGFIEFSGKSLVIEPAAIINSGMFGTTLLDPDYIVIVSGAQPVTCPTTQCGFDASGNNVISGTGTTTLYVNTLRSISTTNSTLHLKAVYGIYTSGTFTEAGIFGTSGSNGLTGTLILETTTVNNSDVNNHISIGLPILFDDVVSLGDGNWGFSHLLIKSATSVSLTGANSLGSTYNHPLYGGGALRNGGDLTIEAQGSVTLGSILAKSINITTTGDVTVTGALNTTQEDGDIGDLSIISDGTVSLAGVVSAITNIMGSSISLSGTVSSADLQLTAKQGAITSTATASLDSSNGLYSFTSATQIGSQANPLTLVTLPSYLFISNPVSGATHLTLQGSTSAETLGLLFESTSNQDVKIYYNNNANVTTYRLFLYDNVILYGGNTCPTVTTQQQCLSAIGASQGTLFSFIRTTNSTTLFTTLYITEQALEQYTDEINLTASAAVSTQGTFNDSNGNGTTDVSISASDFQINTPVLNFGVELLFTGNTTIAVNNGSVGSNGAPLLVNSSNGTLDLLAIGTNASIYISASGTIKMQSLIAANSISCELTCTYTFGTNPISVVSTSTLNLEFDSGEIVGGAVSIGSNQTNLLITDTLTALVSSFALSADRIALKNATLKAPATTITVLKGDLGSQANPLTLVTCTSRTDCLTEVSTVTSSIVTISATNGSIYLGHDTNVIKLLGGTYTFLQSGDYLLSLRQGSGNIVINADPARSTSIVELIAQSGNITQTASAITVRGLSLISKTGSIGTAANPITLCSTCTTPALLYFESASGMSAHIKISGQSNNNWHRYIAGPYKQSVVTYYGASSSATYYLMRYHSVTLSAGSTCTSTATAICLSSIYNPSSISNYYSSSLTDSSNTLVITESVLEGVSSGFLITIEALRGITSSGTFTNGLALANNTGLFLLTDPRNIKFIDPDYFNNLLEQISGSFNVPEATQLCNSGTSYTNSCQINLSGVSITLTDSSFASHNSRANVTAVSLNIMGSGVARAFPDIPPGIIFSVITTPGDVTLKSLAPIIGTSVEGTGTANSITARNISFSASAFGKWFSFATSLVSSDETGNPLKGYGFLYADSTANALDSAPDRPNSFNLYNSGTITVLQTLPIAGYRVSSSCQVLLSILYNNSCSVADERFLSPLLNARASLYSTGIHLRGGFDLSNGISVISDSGFLIANGIINAKRLGSLSSTINFELVLVKTAADVNGSTDIKLPNSSSLSLAAPFSGDNDPGLNPFLSSIWIAAPTGKIIAQENTSVGATDILLYAQGDIGSKSIPLHIVGKASTKIVNNISVPFQFFNTQYIKTVTGSNYLAVDLGLDVLFFSSTLAFKDTAYLFIEDTSTTNGVKSTSTFGLAYTTGTQGFFVANEVLIVQVYNNIQISTNLNFTYPVTLIAKSGSIIGGSTITASNLTLESRQGSIGTIEQPLTIARSSGSWSTTNLSLSTPAGSIYIRTAATGIISTLASATSTISFSETGTFSLDQFSGNITLADNLNYAKKGIRLIASDTTSGNGNINLSASTISVNSFYSNAKGAITFGTNPITASFATLIASSGDLGSANQPLYLARPSTDVWTESNLTLTATNGSIYTKTSSVGVLTALASSTISFLSTGTFSLEQTAGVIDLTGSINYSSATIILKSSTGITTTSGTITASTISLTATSGNIGSITSPIIIARSSSTWTSTNLTLSASAGSIYIKTASSGALQALSATSFRLLAAGTFSLEQSTGDIILASAISLSSAMIRIIASGAIDLGTFSITASSLNLAAAGNITGTGTLTIASTGILNLVSNSASIGTSSNSITIAGATTWSATNLILSATNGSIYIKTASPGVLSAFAAATPTITFLSSETFSLEQTSGNLSTSTPLTFSDASLIFKTSGSSTSISTSSISANSITLTATGNISASGLTARYIILTSDQNIINTGILTAFNISLKALSGDIGSSTSPVYVRGTANTGDITFTSFIADARNIYLQTSRTAKTTELNGLIFTTRPSTNKYIYVPAGNTISITEAQSLTNDISSCTAATNGTGTC
ncbi:MAG: filamentous hemagglutinin N-terminal domain-containing protein, partial [Methylacidiphilales bacterium]|nr:filamentous hemagglutinin N-terminal domain-containing protein [Candidatus Methylacidiphilales bacterium]